MCYSVVMNRRYCDKYSHLVVVDCHTNYVCLAECLVVRCHKLIVLCPDVPIVLFQVLIILIF